jgi:hypothetical protein
MSDELEPETMVAQEGVFEVDRGGPVIMIVTFVDAETQGEPDTVNFSYTKPGSARPYVDDGYGQAGSKITHLGLGMYRYTFSTKSFPSGDGHMAFSAEWTHPLPDGYDSVTVRRIYRVRDAPQSI